ncbi:MAG: cell division ATP-binding protein FtsE [Patescibacteria group bacterium]|nr:cell division ATP-binding protein FtsE [Patescibacteria group bacterium]MDE2144471.1 cell division ATP-binding protein FtsE [Patescibacteria group bacterium]
MIAFQNVYKKYNSHDALADVTFRISPKEFVSLVGRSGAGKSTVVKMLIGEERPTSGRVTFGKYDVAKLQSKDLPQLRRHIGTIFQDFRLLPTKTAYENVSFALEVAGQPEREIETLVPEVLDLVGLSDKSGNFVNELSGGEKQRVAIARAMVNRPEVVVADEPTGNLDPFNTLEIISLLKKINELGTTIILATHNKDVVNQLSRRVITMENGRIIRDEENGRYSLA